MILIFLFIIILLPRAWVLFNSSYTFYSDDAIYAILAKSLLDGHWQYVFHPTWPPLFPAISAFILLFTSNFEFGLRLTSLIFGVVIVIPLYFLVTKTTSKVNAVAYVISLSLFTPLVTISLLPLSDSLAIFLIVSGLISMFFAFLHFPSLVATKLFILSAFSFGLVYLTRAEGTMFFFLTFLYLLFYGILKYRTKQYFLNIIYFTIVFFITISPYVIATRWQIGEWSLSQKFSAQLQQGHAFALNKRESTWAQEIDSAKFPSYNSPYYKNGTEFLLNRLYGLMHTYPEKQLKWQIVFLSVFPIWTISLMLIGTTFLLNKKYIWSMIYLIFIIIIAVPITIFSTPMQDIRYMAWAIPFFLYFFLLGIKKIIHNNSLSALLLFLIILFFPGTSLDNMFNSDKIAKNFTKLYYKNELKIAGMWIKNHSLNLDPKIMMRHEGVEFYSDGETIYMPQISYNHVVKYANNNKVDYIIAWDEELVGDKELMRLLDEKIQHPGLQKVYSIKGHGNVIIYEPIKTKNSI